MTLASQSSCHLPFNCIWVIVLILIVYLLPKFFWASLAAWLHPIFPISRNLFLCGSPHMSLWGPWLDPSAPLLPLPTCFTGANCATLWSVGPFGPWLRLIFTVYHCGSSSPVPRMSLSYPSLILTCKQLINLQQEYHLDICWVPFYYQSHIHYLWIPQYLQVSFLTCFVNKKDKLWLSHLTRRQRRQILTDVWHENSSTSISQTASAWEQVQCIIPSHHQYYRLHLQSLGSL